MHCLLLRLHPTWHWQKSNIIHWLCKTLRTNSGLRAINSCLHLFWPQLCNRNICAVYYVYACVWTHPHFYTDLRPCRPWACELGIYTEKRVMGGEHYEPLIAGPIANHHRRLSTTTTIKGDCTNFMTCFSFYAAIMYIGLDLFWSLSRKIVG